MASPEMRSGQVCVVGSLNMDLVVRSPRLPEPGETLLGSSFATFPGGKGANQAVAARRAGAAVRMIGALGEDSHGSELLGLLATEGIDAGHVVRRRGVPTGVALITVGEDTGENTIVVAGGANQTLTVAEVQAAERRIARAAVLVAQLETPIEAVAAALAIARRAAVPPVTILNAAPACSLPAELLASVDFLVVNRSEAAIVAGASDASLEDVDERLAARGASGVVLTLGAAGALAWTRRAGVERRWRVPAFQVNAVDTVGAGDAFVGSFAATIASGGAVEDALTRAAAAGALATTRRGAIPSLPSRHEVDELLAAQPAIRSRAE